MTIDRDFSGGNIRVLSVEGDTVRVENELRDTTTDWFYWAFRVKGAAGRTLTFDFGEKAWVGRWGAAVSHDGYDWAWSGSVSADFTKFVYNFAADENEVYFCHDIHYSPARFEREARRQLWNVQPMTTSEKGRTVPYVVMGEGERSILLTSRHHACESTGTYVMEGIMKEFGENPLPGYKLIAIPFVDYDGALDGDQGKNRAPHDHNRDYDSDAPLYSTVRFIKALAAWEQIDYFFDLHSPYHMGNDEPVSKDNTNDCVFIVRKNIDKQPQQDRFSRLFEEETLADEKSMRHDYIADIPCDYGWNLDSVMKAACSSFFSHHPKTYLAMSLETAYFGLEDNKVSAEKLIEEGRCVVRALRRFHAEREAGRC